MWTLFGDKKEIEGKESFETASTDLSQPLEVDYEEDPTKLFLKIEDKKWEQVFHFLDTGYWPGSFFPDRISPKDQTRTWVSCFENGVREKLVWSQLPLHLALVMRAPSTVLNQLIMLYPQSVKCVDDQEMLPLHLAMHHGAEDTIVARLLKMFPEAAEAKSITGRLPIEYAVKCTKNPERAFILATFIGKHTERTEKRLGRDFAFEVEALEEEIDAKDEEIESLKGKLNKKQVVEKKKEKGFFKKKSKAPTPAVEAPVHVVAVPEKLASPKNVAFKIEDKDPLEASPAEEPDSTGEIVEAEPSSIESTTKSPKSKPAPIITDSSLPLTVSPVTSPKSPLSPKSLKKEPKFDHLGEMKELVDEALIRNESRLTIKSKIRAVQLDLATMSAAEAETPEGMDKLKEMKHTIKAADVMRLKEELLESQNKGNKSRSVKNMLKSITVSPIPERSYADLLTLERKAETALFGRFPMMKTYKTVVSLKEADKPKPKTFGSPSAVEDGTTRGYSARKTSSPSAEEAPVSPRAAPVAITSTS